LFSCTVDGAVYAQPLWVPAVSIAGGVHNLIVVATQHDSVYVFDADAKPCVTYWKVNLLDTLHGATANEKPVVWNDVGNCYGDIYSEIGVTGTPVINAKHKLFIWSAHPSRTPRIRASVRAPRETFIIDCMPWRSRRVARSSMLR